MVVEDDDDTREALSDLLREHDYDVVAVENGRDALAQLRATPRVQAIVVDVEMPVMNGATFRGEQLSDPELASIPLVLLTGRDDIKALSMALSAAACLRKPIVGDALIRVLDRYR